MTRIFAVVLLCAASSVGCSSIKGLPTVQGVPSQLAMTRSAPRPQVQRASFNQPAVGLNDVDIPCGQGCGTGMCGCCNGVVDGCVGHVLDCNGCCGGGCYGGGCNNGGCNGGGCYGAGCRPGAGCMMNQGKLQALMSRCTCGGTGQCACCQHMKTALGGPIVGRTDAIYNFNPGPSSAQVAYPYYTTRGPRDFFLDNPPSIGPY